MRVTKREYSKKLQNMPDEVTIQARTRFSPGGILFCDVLLSDSSKPLSVVQQTYTEHTSGDDRTIRFRLYEDCAKLMYWTRQGGKDCKVTLDDEDITSSVLKFAKNWIAGMC